MMVCKVEVRGDWEEKSETMRGEKKKIKMNLLIVTKSKLYSQDDVAKWEQINHFCHSEVVVGEELNFQVTEGMKR